MIGPAVAEGAPSRKVLLVDDDALPQRFELDYVRVWNAEPAPIGERG